MLNKKIIWLSRLTFIAVLLAWLVIGLGAYTRLSDAGLGCPDWPGCYGHFSVPASQNINQHKAWAEMIHRYFAGTLGVLVISVSLLTVTIAAKQGFHYLMLAMSLFALIIYQAILGMWTVTLQLLPLIVTQHLLGGMTILALLWLVYLNSQKDKALFQTNYKTNNALKIAAVVGLILISLQIALGAWTSTNYAALSCPDFPYCQSHWTQHFDFRSAFNLLSPIGINYEGGQLSDVARQTIQMIHRLGALIVTLYLLGFITWIQIKNKNTNLRKLSLFILMVLLIQLTLGILNIVLELPLAIAVLHNLVAALLLLSMITINFTIFNKRSKSYESLH